jgi:hypothetical protein
MPSHLSAKDAESDEECLEVIENTKLQASLERHADPIDDFVSGGEGSILNTSVWDRRYLAPGGVAGLFRLYRGTCASLGTRSASFRTFCRVWQDEFAGVLAFREKAEFARCDQCEDYAKFLKDAKTLQERAAIASDWDHHLNATFMDRRVYYRHIENSTRFFAGRESDTVSIIIDGMDQAKFKCPRSSEHSQGSPS